MRLIDAYSAKEALEYTLVGDAASMAERVIDRQPTVDAVPVVRCWECKWWQEDDDVGHCDNPDGLDNYAKPEDFCSYGEQKGCAD